MIHVDSHYILIRKEMQLKDIEGNGAAIETEI